MSALSLHYFREHYISGNPVCPDDLTVPFALACKLETLETFPDLSIALFTHSGEPLLVEMKAG